MRQRRITRDGAQLRHDNFLVVLLGSHGRAKRRVRATPAFGRLRSACDEIDAVHTTSHSSKQLVSHPNTDPHPGNKTQPHAPLFTHRIALLVGQNDGLQPSVLPIFPVEIPSANDTEHRAQCGCLLSFGSVQGAGSNAG